MDRKRQEMVSEIRSRYGFSYPRVLDVMLQIPRHKFIDKRYRKLAYKDSAIDIGFNQTISQPYTVALMTKLVVSAKNKGQSANKKTKILEIGTGSGYQAAVLSKFFSKVYTVEIIHELANLARTVLARLGYNNVYVKVGSGEWGWKAKSPFDAIIVTAGMEKVPKELFDQLKISGVLVAPVGEGKEKTMIIYTKKSKSKFKKEGFGVFTFVPFVTSKHDKISSQC